MASLTKNDLQVVHTAFEQIHDLFDEIDPSDELFEAIGAAEEVAEALTVGGQVDAGDVEVLQDALTALRNEIPLDDVDNLDYDVSDALDELEELLRTIATPAPVLSPVAASAGITAATAADDELTQSL